MWILPKQLLTSAYVPDTKELGLDSEEFSQTSEKSLMWRSKPSLSRTWLQRWKRNNWIQRLSSRILKPSLTNNFVERWTSSQADSPVSHSALLESVKQLMTQDTSSLLSLMESESANLELFSSKTYKESLVAKPVTENQFSNMSSESWKKWVTKQRQEYSQRKKLAHLTRENESSSWATPRASATDSTRPNKKGGIPLADQVKNWPTARTSDAEGGRIETEITPDGFKSKRHKSNQTFGAKLRDAVETYEEKNWATPQAFDHVNIVRTPEKLAKTRAEKNAGCMNLREQVHYPNMDHSRKTAQNWPTPAARDHKGANSVKHCIEKPRHNTQLPNAVMMNDLDKPQNWPTARARDWKDTPGCAPSKIGDVSLPRKVYGLQDPAKPNTNGKSQESWPTPRVGGQDESQETLQARGKSGSLPAKAAPNPSSAKLNPNWVEQLMGLPVGWTQLPTEWTD